MRSAWRSSALPLGETAVEVPAQELADGAGVADGVLGRLDRRVGLLSSQMRGPLSVMDASCARGSVDRKIKNEKSVY